MAKFFESKERGAGDFILFALGFLGFILAASGIVLGSAGLSIFGWLTLLFVAACFLGGSRQDES